MCEGGNSLETLSREVGRETELEPAPRQPESQSVPSKCEQICDY